MVFGNDTGCWTFVMKKFAFLKRTKKFAKYLMYEKLNSGQLLSVMFKLRVEIS